MRSSMRVVAGVFAALSLTGTQAPALFHLATIDEVMTSYAGDANAQFVEIRMLAGAQNLVTNSVLAAFGSDGTYIDDILVVPSNVANSGPGVRWLVGTEAFQTASGVTPDFIMPAGILPSGGGMVCFGGGGGVVPQNPSAWNRTTFSNYVDCVAYGSYSGASNPRIGTPTSLTGDGHSLQRTGSTSNNAADFACGDPATPQNNAGDTESLAATSSCSGGEPTATATEPAEVPTPTATLPPAGGCIGDCCGSGDVAINELIIGVSIALGTTPVSRCEAFDPDGNQTVAISDLIAAVNNALNGCPP